MTASDRSARFLHNHDDQLDEHLVETNRCRMY